MREAAYRYAKKLLPSRGVLVEVFDAMELASQCNMTRPSSSDIHASRSNYLQTVVSNSIWHQKEAGSSAFRKDGQDAAASTTHTASTAGTLDAYYVDGKKGNDANPGTAASPVASVEAGVVLCQRHGSDGGGGGGGGRCNVVVLPAAYYLNDTLLLTAENNDSGLQLTGVPDPRTHERPVLSGGTLLSDLEWVPAPSAAGFPAGVVQAAVPAAVAAAGFDQLFVDGNRVVRRWY